MYGRTGLDRFKKAQSVEPFSVTLNSASKTTSQKSPKTVSEPSVVSQLQTQVKQQNQSVLNRPVEPESTAQHVTQVGGGQSNWQPPDWAIEPRPGVFFLEVTKDGVVLDHINLDNRRHIFGRQFPVCDFVLDHQSVSRQHAAVVPHKNGSIYVIDLGSAHGTFVANERLTKENPENKAALFPSPPLPTEINLPPPPDPSDEEAVVAYNTILNRYGLSKPGIGSGNSSIGSNESCKLERPAKKIKKARVTFRDHVGGQLVEVVGMSDAADVGTEPGPLGVKEGSLVGKYESLIQTTVIPKGKPQISSGEEKVSILNKVKATTKTGGMYDDLYGESFSGKVGSSWAYASDGAGNSEAGSTKGNEGNLIVVPSSKTNATLGYDNNDLFGDLLD
ncbi:hypothetical protein MKX01_030429 [Papaver californicum]|nr:hypothetical protein MKX01_030429 [Papaver californicum]